MNHDLKSQLQKIQNLERFITIVTDIMPQKLLPDFVPIQKNIENAVEMPPATADLFAVSPEFLFTFEIELKNFKRIID